MIEEYKRILKSKLTQKRYDHCINVSKKAVYLAKKYGADVNKAEVAGLLHDITKQTDDEEQLRVIANAGMKLNPVEMANKKLWHAVSGSAYLKTVLNIEDNDILNAVLYHTTGRASMSLLEKIVFLADLISDERDFEEVYAIRDLAEKDLNKAVCVAAAFSIKFLISKNVVIASNTLEAYNDNVKFLT